MTAAVAPSDLALEGRRLALPSLSWHAEGPPVIVVGAGPAGNRVAQDLARRGQPVLMFNAERWQPYNRVKLTPLLSGEAQIGQIYTPIAPELDAAVRQIHGLRITAIDRPQRCVIDQHGQRWAYRMLVLCTGSRPHLPQIPGIDTPGVYTFRDVDDVEWLRARTVRARRVVVIGGGLLGLEAARGMAARGAVTTVVEHSGHLMPRQLDGAGGRRLAARICELGVHAITATHVKAIIGQHRVSHVELGNGLLLFCDTVIVCAGVRANLELARAAGLATARGIQVDDQMRTGDPAIFAVGECAEVGGTVYGLVAPCLEQAAVAAAAITGGQRRYAGSLPATKLKIVGVDVFSMGEVDQLDSRRDIETLIWREHDGAAYRRLVIGHGRLIGALGLGPWPELNRLQHAIARQQPIGLWQRRRFVRRGRIWRASKPRTVHDWPTNATVCNCTGVTRGQIGDAMQQGCVTFEALRQETGCSTVCGSCRPLVTELLGVPPRRDAVRGWRWLAALSCLALLGVLLTGALPSWPYSDTVQGGFALDVLWRDGVLKQITGFSLLGLAASAALLSLRKRVKTLRFGSFDGWRIVHGALGLLMLGTAFAHTGFRLGHNLNLWLMLTFLALTGLGATAGAVAALEHQFGRQDGSVRQWPRRLSTWLHILAFWPLPVLLFAHILSVYAY